MILYGVNMKAITKYVSGVVYILLYLFHNLKNSIAKYYIKNILAIFYGPMWSVCICGLLINNLLGEEMHKYYKTSKLSLFLSDIFGHILPLIVIIYYGPKKTDVSFLTYLFIIFIFFVLTKNYLIKTYIGVPPVLITTIAPSICIIMFYHKYISV